MVSGALVLSLGGLFGFHSYLIMTNGSTLEIADFDQGNPFKRVRKVFKSQADRQARDPVRLFVGAQRDQRQARTNQLTGNNQMKQVTAFLQNMQDTLGTD